MTLKDVLHALTLAKGVAERAISASGFDESQVSDWRPVVDAAIAELRSEITEVERLRAGYRGILALSDSQMEDGDAARRIARALLGPEEANRIDPHPGY